MPAHQLRELVLPLLDDSPEAFLLVDDSVQDKRYSRFIEVAKRQYSGAVHGMVTGIGLVNLVHSSGQAGDFLPLDYRIYAPEDDEQTKNEHFPGHVRPRGGRGQHPGPHAPVRLPGTAAATISSAFTAPVGRFSRP